MEEVQDELIHRLTIGRSAAQKKFHVPRSNAPVVNINYDSSPEDVKMWLQAKGFNSVTVNSLGVLTGAQLFSLNKDELKSVCPEGARVYSQITVQKATLEVCTEAFSPCINYPYFICRKLMSFHKAWNERSNRCCK
ncbi:epidermal growth factor receptor kinase substrate 8-like [Sceloporus undulatus]|uniref:epidermal growth factor receptor kinase substrate 8-like n=1 Tax=Sceloporus undulatus TaxID=8520 RepID=UPI001C4AA618|nr:epidermal growth factor receptor kinase substrate 8-like [Sceloporus undulatus]